MHASGNSSQMVELLPLFRAELDLCRLRAGERVLLYSDTFTDPAYPAACLAATLEAGAVPVVVTVPATAPEIEDAAALAAVRRGCALVVDLVSQGRHGYTSPLNRAVESGTRILWVAEPPDVLARLWGCDPRSRWGRMPSLLQEPGCIMDVENAAGNLLLVFGSNTAVNLRGTVRSAAHLNVNSRGHTVMLDGRPVVVDGTPVYA